MPLKSEMKQRRRLKRLKRLNDFNVQTNNKYQDVSVKVKDKYETISANLNYIKDNYELYKDKLVSMTTEVCKHVGTELNLL